jgi:DNA-binding GntR family transcriptional regulator
MVSIEQRSLHGELLGRLRNMITGGDLPQGEKIPERELCQQFGVSRTPLREAIKVLAHEGLVRLEPHRGAIVADTTVEELEECLPIFAALETLSAELACEHITDDEIAAIRTYHDHMLEAYEAGNEEGFIAFNHKIHHSILRAARNSLLTSIYEATCFRTGRRRVCTKLPREAVDEGMADHDEIMAALEARDGKRLAKLLGSHIERLLGVYSASLKAEQKSGDDLERRCA